MSECESGHCCHTGGSCDENDDDMLSCEYESRADDFLCLAKIAHRKLLKKKMMAAFEAKIGKKMDEVADLVVSTALVYMQDEMNEDTAREQYEAKLMDIFKAEK